MRLQAKLLQGNLQMKKLLLCLSLLTLCLSSCADRSRVNCERIKNKAPGVVTPENNLGAKCQ